MSDELKLCRCLPTLTPAVLKRAMDVMEGGREKSICLLSSSWVKPNWAASYSQEKGQVNKCVCGLKQLCKGIHTAEKFERSA